MNEIKQISSLLGINPLAEMDFYDNLPRPTGYFPFGAPWAGKREKVTKYEDGTHSCSCGKQNCIHQLRALGVRLESTGKMWRIIK